MNYNHLLNAQEAARAAFGYDDTLETQSAMTGKRAAIQNLFNRLKNRNS